MLCRGQVHSHSVCPVVQASHGHDEAKSSRTIYRACIPTYVSRGSATDADSLCPRPDQVAVLQEPFRDEEIEDLFVARILFPLPTQVMYACMPKASYEDACSRT
jgi:hypothetical protein